MKHKLCYLIMAHSDPEHLSKLVDSLDYKADFYIHIDKKFDISEFKNAVVNPNIIWIENRHEVYWAHISQVDATIEAIRCALTNETDYLKFILISGSCFPIKSAKDIYEYFLGNVNVEHIRYIDMRESKDHYLKQIKHRWFIKPLLKHTNRPYKLIDRIFRGVLNRCNFRNDWDEKWVPYFGSQWWALTPDCCAYILKFIDESPAYYRMNVPTFSPDEHFFHTIVGNSEFALRATGLQVFTGRGTYKLANLHLIHPSLEKWYDHNDYQNIIKSEKLFVRKLRSQDSRELREMLNSHAPSIL